MSAEFHMTSGPPRETKKTNTAGTAKNENGLGLNPKSPGLVPSIMQVFGPDSSGTSGAPPKSSPHFTIEAGNESGKPGLGDIEITME